MWQVISIDMIRELLDLKGYNAVLVVVDCLSKQIHTIPTVTSLDSAGVAWLFLKHIWCCKRTKRALSTPTVHTTDREKEGGQDSLSAKVNLLSCSS